jgi:hypothetical protein
MSRAELEDWAHTPPVYFSIALFQSESLFFASYLRIEERELEAGGLN